MGAVAVVVSPHAIVRTAPGQAPPGARRGPIHVPVEGARPASHHALHAVAALAVFGALRGACVAHVVDGGAWLAVSVAQRGCNTTDACAHYGRRTRPAVIQRSTH